MDAHTKTSHHDMHDDPGPLYKEKWVQDLIRQIEEYLQANSAWLGLDNSKSQRVLDYACGNGTVSRALLTAFPNALFRGLDVAPAQVQRFNDEARKLLGESRDRMIAIEGDLIEPNPALGEPEWFDFDAAIISMALHHVTDPVDLLVRLGKRVKKGGVLVVVDWLSQEPARQNSEHQSTTVHDSGQDGNYHTHHPMGMVQVLGGPKIWPGFTLEEIKADMAAAALTSIDIKPHPQTSLVPMQTSGYNRMFLAKATVQ